MEHGYEYQSTLNTIRAYMMTYHAGVDLKVDEQHQAVILDIHGNHPAFQEDRVWTDLKIALRRNQFIKAFLIRLNGRNIFEHLPEGVAEERKMLNEYMKEQTTLVEFNDSRFDSDREFLPPDVSTDLKILLESTGSVEEFLKSV